MEHSRNRHPSWHDQPRATLQSRRRDRVRFDLFGGENKLAGARVIGYALIYRGEADGLAGKTMPQYLVIKREICSRFHARKPLANKHCSITLATTHPRDAMHLGAEEIETTQLTGV